MEHHLLLFELCSTISTLQENHTSWFMIANCCSQMIMELKVISVNKVTQHVDHYFPVFSDVVFTAATQLTSKNTSLFRLFSILACHLKCGMILVFYC